MKIEILQQHHPSFDAEAVAQREALYEGGEVWRVLLGTWIPKLPQEMDDVWKGRQKRATYENNVGPIIDILAGALFTEAPSFDGLEGPWLEDFAKNADSLGTPLVTWFRERLVDAMVGRRAYAWINLPARGDLAPESRAEEESAGLLDAFLVPLTAEQVIDWGEDERGRLTWVMVRDCVSRRESPEMPRSKVYRWTAIDRERIKRWEWTPREGQDEPREDDDAAEVLDILHGLSELPIVRLELPSGLHALGKLHDPAVALLRAQNDLDWGLHRGAHALLWIRSKWGDKKPVFGPGYYIELGRDDKGGDEMGYAEPSGKSFDLLAKRVTQLREGLYRVVHQMAVGADSNANRSLSSAESKAEDWRATEIVLTAYASLVRPFIAEVMRVVSKARGQEQRPGVRGLEGWHNEGLTEWLLAAATATEAMRMSETFQRRLALEQVNRVLQDLPEDVRLKIEAEIEAAVIDPAPYIPPLPPGDDPEDDDPSEA